MVEPERVAVAELEAELVAVPERVAIMLLESDAKPLYETDPDSVGRSTKTYVILGLDDIVELI